MRGGIRPFEVEEEREGGRRRRRGAEHQRLVGKARAGRERERGDEPAVADEARLDGPIFSWGPLVGNKAGSIFPLLLASFSVFFHGSAHLVPRTSRIMRKFKCCL